MAMLHEIGTLRDAPLEEVLLKLYPATILKWLYDVNLRELAETYPGALPQLDRTLTYGADKTPKKAYLMALLLAVLRDKTMGGRFFSTLPEPTRSVLAAVTWEKQVNLAALEQSLGCQIAVQNPEERRTFYEPFVLPPAHGFLLVGRSGDDRWYYYSRSDKQKKEDYCLSLPDEIRKAFRAFVPPPPGYELLPLDGVPASTGTRYSCAQTAIADLRLVAEYIAQGHLKYTKAERIATPSLKVLRQITAGPEFFPDATDSDLTLLRTRLFAGGMASAGQRERENLLAHPESAESVRELFASVSGNEYERSPMKP